MASRKVTHKLLDSSNPKAGPLCGRVGRSGRWFYSYVLVDCKRCEFAARKLQARAANIGR